MLFFFFSFYLCVNQFSCRPVIYFSFNVNVNWLPGSTSPDGYSKQPVLLLHLIFLFLIIFSYKCKRTLKVVVVVVVVVVVAKHTRTFFTKVLLTNAKPTGKIVYYALTAGFWLLLVAAGPVVLCKTKTLDMKPEWMLLEHLVTLKLISVHWLLRDIKHRRIVFSICWPTAPMLLRL